MCISLPAKVVSLDGNSAQVEAAGTQRKVLLAVSNLSVGAWVLVHGGIAIAKLQPAEAEETMQLIAQLANPGLDS